jgi:hypothetical protein
MKKQVHNKRRAKEGKLWLMGFCARKAPCNKDIRFIHTMQLSKFWE